MLPTMGWLHNTKSATDHNKFTCWLLNTESSPRTSWKFLWLGSWLEAKRWPRIFSQVCWSFLLAVGRKCSETVWLCYSAKLESGSENDPTSLPTSVKWLIFYEFFGLNRNESLQQDPVGGSCTDTPRAAALPGLVKRATSKFISNHSLHRYLRERMLQCFPHSPQTAATHSTDSTSHVHTLDNRLYF